MEERSMPPTAPASKPSRPPHPAPEVRAPGKQEIDFPHGTEIDLPGEVRPEMQVGDFKPLGTVNSRGKNSLGNFEAAPDIPENGIEN